MSNPLPEVISIVACGPTALVCGAARAPGYVIAVNDAYREVRHDTVLSMDGRWAAYRANDWGRLGRVEPLHLRRRAYDHVIQPEGGLRHIYIFENVHSTETFGDTMGQLNGPNSGYCALNLAFVMRPRKLYLFGFDHKGTHFHRESEWVKRNEGSHNGPRKWAAWSVACYAARDQFDAANIEVINTNSDSAVRAFEFGDAP